MRIILVLFTACAVVFFTGGKSIGPAGERENLPLITIPVQ